MYPNSNERPKFSQLYVFDTDAELNNRFENFNNLNKELVKILQDMMHDNNPYVYIYKDASKIMQSTANNAKLVLHCDA